MNLYISAVFCGWFIASVTMTANATEIPEPERSEPNSNQEDPDHPENRDEVKEEPKPNQEDPDPQAQKRKLDESRERLVEVQKAIERKERELDALENKRKEIEAKAGKSQEALNDKEKEIKEKKAQLDELVRVSDSTEKKIQTLSDELKPLREMSNKVEEVGTEFIATDVLEIKVGNIGAGVEPADLNQIYTLVDDEETCQIKISSRMSPTSMQEHGSSTQQEASLQHRLPQKLSDRGVEEVFIRGEKGDFRIPLDLDLKRKEELLSHHEICAKIERYVDNRANLELVIVWKSYERAKRDVVIKMRYEKPKFEGTLGISTYLGGGGEDFGNLKRKSQLAVITALTAGGKWNLPMRTAPDFYLGISGLFGFGLVSSKTSQDAQANQDGDANPLSLLAGVSLSIGDFLELGWAYDLCKGTHLIVFSPSSILAERWSP